MGELINGRTPEEIKRVLAWKIFRCCNIGCDNCSYGDICSDENEERSEPDALALIEHLESERDAEPAKVPKWISIKERLPENGRMVIGFTPCDGFMFVGYYREYQLADYKWSQWEITTAMRSSRKVTKKVTHWMPLPEPPEEGLE